jgi:hypothetical protein
MGRYPKNKPAENKPADLPCEASGERFRLWLEAVLFAAKQEIGAFVRDDQLRTPPAIINFLVGRTEVDEKSFRSYLSLVKSTAGNPRLLTAVKIARGLRDISPYANPLCMLYAVEEFRPHAWGVIGHLCAPGPTNEVMAIWPALCWIIDPLKTPQGEVGRVLMSDTFHALFDKAWDTWNAANSTSSFPVALRNLIDLSGKVPRDLMHTINDDSLKAWAEWVTRDPRSFGYGMRLLDGRAISAREVFEREIDRWDTQRMFNEQAVAANSIYLRTLTDEERIRLLSRANAILMSQESWRHLATFLDLTPH